MSVTVRFAARDDIPRINELRRQVNALHVAGRPDFFRAGFNDELLNYTYAELENENADVIAAEKNGVICGFAMLQYIKRPQSPYRYALKYCNVEELGVDLNCRRQGIATAIIDFIRSDAKAKGFEQVKLDVWEFNKEALAFYESVGFKTYRRYMEI